MLDPGSYSGTYEAAAGRLCLNFANTLAWRNSDRQHDWLNSYANLVEWGKVVGILSEENAGWLRQQATGRPEDADGVMDLAVGLRETIYHIFSAVAAGVAPHSTDLHALNSALAQALIHLRVVPEADVFVWDWAGDGSELDAMLWPVVWSAGKLLTAEELNRVGECHGDGCGWLFVDMSRNHSRRWCDMGDCGNRAKARRHYRRKRASLHVDQIEN